MPDPIPAPAAPAAVPPAPAPEPTPTPTPPPVAPAAEPKSSLLSNILNLVEPDAKPATPPADPKAATPPADPKATPPADPKAATPPADPKAATPPADPKATPPAQPPAEGKKVPVKRKETPKFTSPEDIQKAVETALKNNPPAAPAPAATAPAAPAPAPVDTDLTPEEKEELELATYAEQKDPSKKGLAAGFRKFYAEHKKFLSDRLAEEGADYDPSSDPRYKAFLAKNEPKFTAAERKTLFREKTIEEAETRALQKAEEKLRPQISQVERSVREIKERPAIAHAVNTFLEETAAGMPEDVYKFYVENGKDLEKTRAEFPMETDHIMSTLQGAASLAHEFLELRKGLRDFDPKDGMHQYLDKFVNDQADWFLQKGGDLLIRNGKSFVHPRQWKPGMEKTNWTFEDNDILVGLKVAAQREAKGLVANARKQLEEAVAAKNRRATPPNGGANPPATPPPAEPKAPVTPPAPSPGAAAAEPTPSKSVLSGLLHL